MKNLSQDPVNEIAVPNIENASHEDECNYYNQVKEIRKLQYPEFNDRLGKLEIKYATEISLLKQNGYVKLENVLDISQIDKTFKSMDEMIENGNGVIPPRDLRKFKENSEIDHMQLPRIRSEDLKQGSDFLRKATNTVDIQDPLKSIPSILSLALDEQILDLINAYCGCLTSLGYVKFRRSYANDFPLYDTNYYHYDGGTIRPIRVFIYLKDVDESTGPFCFVKGSHTKKFDGWRDRTRWSYEEMVELYGEENLIRLTAQKGDLIIADNAGYHAAVKPISKDRNALLLTYLIHKEYAGGPPCGYKLIDTEFLNDYQKSSLYLLAAEN